VGLNFEARKQELPYLAVRLVMRGRQLHSIPIRACHRVQPDERLRDQDGSRFHDLYLDGRFLHPLRGALACFPRIRSCPGAPDWELLSAMEFRRLAYLGPTPQHPYLD
jgi:hypothetical protein